MSGATGRSAAGEAFPAAGASPAREARPAAPALALVPGGRAPASAGVPRPAVPPAPARIASIRWIVASAMMALVVAVVLSAGAVTERNARRALAAEMTAGLQLQARNLALVASDALLTETPEWSLIPVVRQTLERQPQLAFLTVVDREGRIQAGADVRQIGTPFVPPASLVAEPGAPPPIAGESVLGNPTLLVVEAPVMDASGRRLGSAWVGLHRAAIGRRLDQARRQQLVVLGAFLVLGALAALVVSSALLRPVAALRQGLERIGRGDLEARLEVRDRTEIGALAGTVNRMADELGRAQRDLVQRERLAHEIQLAQRIQQSLLPAQRRIADSFVIEGAQQAAAEVGGDYWQTLDLPDGRIGLVMADVSGKGLGGALVTAMLHALLRALAPRHTTPGALLASLDAQIGTMLERGSFVTMFYGILAPATGELVFASAGHNPLLVLRRAGGAPEWVRGRGAPLGAFRGPRHGPVFEEVRLQLEPGDCAIQYTDGVTEAFGPGGTEQFGAARLADVAARAHRRGHREVLDDVTREVEAWREGMPRGDDETLLMVGRELLGGGENGSNPAEISEALECLSQAQSRGEKLTLPASLSALVRLDDWLARVTPARHLASRSASLLKLAIHEACANVVEHACGCDPAASVELWWVPGPAEATEGDRLAALGQGYFLLCDRGVPFRYQEWEPPDFASPEVRRRGRGLGLDILHRVTRSIRYFPSTPEGNLVQLTFDPGTL